MPLYKVTTKRDLLVERGSGWIPKGASVEVPINVGCSLMPQDIKDAFIRKYGNCPDTTGVQCCCDVLKIS
jgi:hypothetical protein